MTLEYLTRSELQSILAQLEQSLYNHIQWHYNLVRNLVCRMHGNDQDIHPDAHHNCLFGQWYYNHAPTSILTHPSFIAIGEAHQRMHKLTAGLIVTVNTGGQIKTQEYDTFNNAMEQLRLEIDSLKHEVEIALYTHDPLTGAINRADMLPALREIHEMVKREAQVCSLVMMDVDRFKDINDKYGHTAGDKVLGEVVRYIISHLRPYDKLFRYGGEEFLICMQNTDPDDCFNRIEILREGIAGLPIDLGERDPVSITVSFGITNMVAYLEIEQCIDMADKAMYAAKAGGRNKSVIWDPSIK